MRKLFALLSLLVLASLVLAACGGGATTAPTEEPAIGTPRVSGMALAPRSPQVSSAAWQ